MMTEYEQLCAGHIGEAQTEEDYSEQIYWVHHVVRANDIRCDVVGCGLPRAWSAFSRNELEMTDDTRYVPADDTHAKLEEILVALRAQEQPAVKLQIKSGTGAKSVEGYELTVTDAVTEASLMNAFVAAMRGRELIHAKLYAPIDPDSEPVAYG